MKEFNNIFVSTTFAEDGSKISDVLLTCKKENISNIELGSNHTYEKNFKKIIKQYDFHFIVHNYFPIPRKSFVVNIASLDEHIRNLSLKHIKKAITFCSDTNANLYTFHPGFIGDPYQASKSKKNYDFIWRQKFLKQNYQLAFSHMISSLKKIIDFAKKKHVRVAIETEGSFKKKNFGLMQKPEEYQKLLRYFKPKDLGINLNIGHLNLASKAFNFSKLKFIKTIKPHVVAMELSHNNGIEDQHLPLKRNEWYWKIINDPDFSKVYKILEFRNTSIKNIKNVLKLLNR